MNCSVWGQSEDVRCTEAGFFSTRVRIDAHPVNTVYNSSSDYTFDVVLSGRDTTGGTGCPLLHVTWDETWDDGGGGTDLIR
ncbi:MAG: hypothetical protein PSX37_07680, partial [bacterium]|nr:hypothetical protein [bacterium]